VPAPDLAPDPRTEAERLLEALRYLASPAVVAGMARVGICARGTLGVQMRDLRTIARDTLRTCRRDGPLRHAIAAALWSSGVHEARILATLLDVPALVDARQADAWVAELDSWDVCDALVNNLLRDGPLGWPKARAWVAREEEFVRRAGLVLAATRAVHHRDVPDDRFEPFLRTCERAADDRRSAVKKAVSWAMRRIGMRSPRLRRAALASARRLRARDAPSARWIGADVERALRRPAPAAARPPPSPSRARRRG
jgi:3-methyladenine DNA glycosylase AlkD